MLTLNASYRCLINCVTPACMPFLSTFFLFLGLFYIVISSSCPRLHLLAPSSFYLALSSFLFLFSYEWLSKGFRAGSGLMGGPVYGLGVVPGLDIDFDSQCEYNSAMRLVPDRHRQADERSL